MTEESDGQQNLPATVHTTSPVIPVAEFEGEYVRTMIGKIPAINLEMEVGYARGTHLKVEIELRVKGARVDEYAAGKRKGELFREHSFAIEDVKLVGVYTADEMDPGVGGSAAISEDDKQELDERLNDAGEVTDDDTSEANEKESNDVGF